MSKDLLTVNFSGRRIAHYTLPAEIIEDLNILESMIFDQVKSHYFKTHPDCKNLPESFFNNKISLSRIENESSKCSVNLIYTLQQSLHIPELEEYYMSAINDLIGVIKKGENDRLFNLTYSDQKILKNFDKFGCSLSDGDSISFASADDNAVMTKTSRQQMILASENTEYYESLGDYGTVSAIDVKNYTFKISFFSNENRCVDAPLSDECFMIMKNDIINSEKSHTVWIYGIGIFNRNKKLIKMASITGLFLLDPLNVQARLYELSFLKDGWYDGKGQVPPNGSLKTLSSMFSENYSEDAPLPRIYPTLDGNISAEWTIADWEVGFEIDMHSMNGTFLAVNASSDNEIEMKVNLNDADGWKCLNDALADLNDARMD